MIEVTCVLSALLFLVSNILGFSFFNKFHHRAHSSWEDFTNLETDYIVEEFGHRRDLYAHELAAGILNAIAWMVFCIPLLQVAWIQSRHGTHLLGTHVSIAALALGGSVTELISRLMFIGTTAATNWISRRFNLDHWLDMSDAGVIVASTTASSSGQDGGDAANAAADMIGWRVLQIVHIVNRGLLLWIDAAEWLFLSAIFALIYLSVCKTQDHSYDSRRFSMSWARLGLIMAFLAFVDFSSDVLRLQSWLTFSSVAIFISVISRTILMPLWLVWLGIQLPAIKLARAQEKDGNAVRRESHQEMTRSQSSSYGSANLDSGAMPDNAASIFS